MNITVITSVLTSLALSVLGMFFIAWFNEITNPTEENPSLKEFFKKNANPFVYAVITNFILIVIFAVAPEIASLVGVAFGLNVTVPIQNGSGIVLGIGAYEIIRKRFKLKAKDIVIKEVKD